MKARTPGAGPLSAKARRLLAALGEGGLTREEWQRASGWRNISLYPELRELIWGGHVQKISTPAGNLFVHRERNPD